jgi:hypothetical protein
MAALHSSQHEIALESGKKLGLQVTLVPADQLPEALHGDTNVAKVQIAGKDFFAVVGKTTVA